ncbi:MAG TPA: glycosyltransferase family 1 protein [Candidatus Moranbacteria bacterium]|nr:glycosyltransferase family 1 protein [Candidatus Moranbacteria bacterium]HRZ33330.1 glycosyltransferase family 1 protein [Candidatus Moranbacteria bacterium]
MNIIVIIEKRNDAIGTYNRYLVHELRNIPNANINVFEINNKVFKNKILNIFLEIFNSWRLFLKLRKLKNNALLFTNPKSISANICYLLKNKKYAIIHHLENNPAYYKIFPMKSLLSCFDRVICISKFSRSQVLSIGISVKKISVVYNGLDHKIFKPILEKNENFQEKYILSIGSEIPRKNMANIIKTFSLLKKDFKNLKLLKIGLAEKKYRQKTLSIIRNLDLKNDVVFINYVEEKKLPMFYSNAELLLFPSLMEGFGFPIVEAMACGCPVVTSNLNPMKELTQNTQILINPLNPNEIYEKCKEILNDSEKKIKMKKEGIKIAQNFDWKITARKIYDIVTRN